MVLTIQATKINKPYKIKKFPSRENELESPWNVGISIGIQASNY